MDIQRMANEVVRRLQAERDAERESAHRATEPTTEQRLAEARFRELVTFEALMSGVNPRAVRHVIAEARTVFVLEDDALVPKHGQVDPRDPLTPLTPAAWLEQLAKSDSYLFLTPDRTH